MLSDISFAFLRARHTLLSDAAGLAAIVVVLLVSLHLPGM